MMSLSDSLCVLWDGPLRAFLREPMDDRDMTVERVRSVTLGTAETVEDIKETSAWKSRTSCVWKVESQGADTAIGRQRIRFGKQFSEPPLTLSIDEVALNKMRIYICECVCMFVNVERLVAVLVSLRGPSVDP